MVKYHPIVRNPKKGVLVLILMKTYVEDYNHESLWIQSKRLQ